MLPMMADYLERMSNLHQEMAQDERWHRDQAAFA